MTELTAAQILEVRAPSTKYAKDAYETVIASFTKAKRSKGRSRIEADFPGVKPQHVAFMLKKVIGDAEDLVVVITADHGVCILKNA